MTTTTAPTPMPVDALLAAGGFRPLDSLERDCFSGASDAATIVEHGDLMYIADLDEDAHIRLTAYDAEGSWWLLVGRDWEAM